MSTIEEIEQRRAARKAGVSAARDAQYLIDLEALDALEEEHGDGKVAQLNLPNFTPGLPTMIVVRTPEPRYYKRFEDMVRKAKDADATGRASDMLADCCVVYPDAATYVRVREAYPAVRGPIGHAAVTLAQARAADEGKG